MPKIPKVILLIENSRGFGRDLLNGIAQYSRLHGPWTFYQLPPFFRSTGGRKTIMKRLKNWGADGMIIRDVPNINELVDLNIPTILATTIVKDPKNFPTVKTDNKAIAEMAAEHLINRGFRQFAYCGFGEIGWSRERGKFFTERVKKAGFPFFEYEQPKKHFQRSWDIEQQFVASWLKSLPKPLGLMSCGDERSQQVVDACKSVDIHVPEEVAVVGVDNDKLVCNLSNPHLSSIVLNTTKAGYEVAELLKDLMQGEKMASQQIIISPTHVETRQSSNVLAIEDEDVAKAAKFIREHARDPISVVDVAEGVFVSRRLLERRFRKVLHRSILDEIRRVRVEKITNLLIETNLPVSKIAATLGYSSIAHIARYFRKEKNMSLLEFRKQYGHK